MTKSNFKKSAMVVRVQEIILVTSTKNVTKITSQNFSIFFFWMKI